jgi:hypothetical protein
MASTNERGADRERSVPLCRGSYRVLTSSASSWFTRPVRCFRRPPRRAAGHLATSPVLAQRRPSRPRHVPHRRSPRRVFRGASMSIPCLPPGRSHRPREAAAQPFPGLPADEYLLLTASIGAIFPHGGRARPTRCLLDHELCGAGCRTTPIPLRTRSPRRPRHHQLTRSRGTPRPGVIP